MINVDRAQQAQEIRTRRKSVIANYQQRWQDMIQAWRQARDNDALWLMYAANYLFNTRTLRWAVDPVRLCNRLPDAESFNITNDLDTLDFALLTHIHADHMDVGLWQQLSTTTCHWIVPDHMADFFHDQPAMRHTPHTIAVPGREVAIGSVRILPFISPHYETLPDGSIFGVPSTGYRVSIGTRVYLFPGDIRNYDPATLRPFSSGVSAVFAHVFLGRSAAVIPDPPLMDAFIDFYRQCRPRQIVLTHLYELPRDVDDCWLPLHARAVADAYASFDSTINVLIPTWYDEVLL